jgi:hypothetical protein
VPATLTSARAALLACLLVALIGCERGGDRRAAAAARAPGDAAREWAVTVDHDRARLARKDWSSIAGSDSSRLSGFSAGDSLKLVREVRSLGGAGREAARFYFQGAQLRYYEMEGERITAAGARQKVRLVLAFDELGTVVARAAEVARQWATTPAESRTR